ncbi:helix-turn-helix domain-containing protein [Microbacterium proteolyticum]|uniref:helix-turn-helix domain-containing protein n=1 Tax=Microbacterium proteolyticum TaxID=1572644 RepID=UPI001609D27B
MSATQLSTRGVLRSGRLTGLGLTAGERLVLIVLIDHADADGITFPAERTIANESGMQRSGVQKQLPALVRNGVIRVVQEGGPRSSTRYQIAPQLWTTG